MNVTEEKKVLYGQNFLFDEIYMRLIFGGPESFYCFDTYQVEVHSKVLADRFDDERKSSNTHRGYAFEHYCGISGFGETESIRMPQNHLTYQPASIMLLIDLALESLGTVRQSTNCPKDGRFRDWVQFPAGRLPRDV